MAILPDCLSCDMFEPLDQLAQAYGHEAFNAIAGPTRTAFNAFVGLWGAWVLAVDGALLGRLDFRKVAGQVAVFSLCGILLLGVDLYWSWFYQPVYEAMNGIATSLVTGATGVEAHSLQDMLRAVEGAVRRVLFVASQMIAEAGIRSIGLAFYGLLMALPFLFVWGIFLAYILEGIFKLLAITAVSPLLIAAAAFRPSRGFAVSGFRIVLGGVLTVVFAAVAMGFTLSVASNFIGQIPVSSDGWSAAMATWVGGDGYWGMILLGFVSVLFHLKAATLAANISGASDGPGAAATVVAGGLAAVAAAKGAALWSAGKAGGFGGRGLGAIGEAAARNHDRIWGQGKDAARSGGN